MDTTVSVEMSAESKYLDLKTIADELGVSVSTIKRRIYNGELEYVRVGKLYRVERSSYEKWLEKQSSRKDQVDTGSTATSQE